MPGILKEAGCEGIPLEVLSCFTGGLEMVFKNLLQPEPTLSRQQYEIQSRILLGYQFVTILGTTRATPSIKQIVVYVPYYIEKAQQDGATIGLPLTISNFSDGLMEAIHKRAKCGNFLFSGGTKGPISSSAYQQQLLTQIFAHELNMTENNSEIYLSRMQTAGTGRGEPEVKKHKVEVTYFDVQKAVYLGFQAKNRFETIFLF